MSSFSRYPSADSFPGVPRAATGTIEEHPWKDGKTVTFRLRVPLRGRKPRITLGTNHEGWNRERAQAELDRVLEQLRRGTWTPPGREVPPPEPDNFEGETIHLTLSRWWQGKRTEIAENTRSDYRWRLDLILAFRHNTLTSEVDERWVDELRDWLAKQPAKNRKKGSNKTLSPNSVNKVLAALAQALDLAVDYKQLPANPARGKRRRMKVAKSKGSFLEPDMVIDLLKVAGEWEAELIARNRAFECYGRRELLALLCLGGPRISEATAAARGEFDLAGDHWRIPDSKTQAGARTVELTVTAAEELRTHVASQASRSRSTSARKPMWSTRTGQDLGQGNVRRMLREVVARTNERREDADKMLLPAVTPHTLRRTFASLCFFAGRDPAWVMGQIGHTDARLTLAVYAQTMQRKRVDRDLVWRLMRFADEPERWPGYGPRSGPSPEILTSDPDVRVRDA